MIRVDLSYLVNGKWPFLKLAKFSLIALVFWILFSLSSDNYYVKHFIPTFIISLPSTKGLSLSFDKQPDSIKKSENVPAQQIIKRLSFHENIKIASEVANCGLNHECPATSIPISLFTGKDNQQYPELCVDGKVIISKGVNNCGRGINVAIIDNVTRTVTRVINYDTYGSDSSGLETMLLTLRRGEIIIMITFDEPSTKLSTVARLLLHELGSSQAQNLQFRTSWYFITCKGLNGYSPYEEIAFPDTGGWGRSLYLNTCLPFQFEGQIIKPDETVIDNSPRLQFCENYGSQWPLFCESNLINDPLMTSKIFRPLPISPEILRTPIVVIHRVCDNKYFPLLLETILRQPEVNPAKVMVATRSTCHGSIVDLIKVFSYEWIFVNIDSESHVNEILDKVEQFYRYAHQIILIEDSVILGPDFLPFIGQLLPLLHYGVSVISAWNENGFTNTSSDPSLVYRATSTYPARLAFMIKRGTRLKPQLIGSSLWWPQLFNHKGKPLQGDIVIPDQSRILPTWPIGPNGPGYNAKFPLSFDGNQERSVSIEEEIFLIDVFSLLSSDNYGRKIISSFNESSQYTSLESYLADSKRNEHKEIALVCADMENCQNYCKYFGIIHCHFHVDIPSLGNIIRFSLNPNRIKAMIVKHN